MNCTTLVVQRGSCSYTLCPWTGNLLVQEASKSEKKIEIPIKINSALTYCDNPYVLNPNWPEDKPTQLIESSKPKRYAKTIIYLCKYNFFLARYYSSFKADLFQTSVEAISYFRKNFPDIDQAEACLARSLFAVKTSIEFRRSGALIIGVFLPSRAMHAWIIENHMQPDPQDRSWTSFQPVALIHP